MPRPLSNCLLSLPLLIGIVIVIVTSPPTVADDWTQFLGPQRTGVAAERDLVGAFGDDGPRVVWNAEVGVGMSGVAVQEHAVLTMGQDASEQFVVRLDARTGDVIWRTAIDEPYENSMGDGPRATPTIAGTRVFAFSGAGRLAALNLADGRVLWVADPTALTGGRSAEYGNASSPLVVESRVIVQYGSPQSSVIAFDAETGDRDWQAGSGSAGYSSPVRMRLNGVDQVVALTGSEVLGLNPATGAVWWRHAWPTEYDCNTASPVRIGEHQVLISSGENHGAVILEIRGSSDALQAVPVWESTGPSSVLRAEWQTPVLIDGHVYGLDNSGSAGPVTNFVCVRLADGEQLWNVRRFGKSNFTVADGRFWFSTMKGELVVGTATPDGFRETSRHTLTGMTRQAPVIANGRLYLRDETDVVCVDVSAKD